MAVALQQPFRRSNDASGITHRAVDGINYRPIKGMGDTDRSRPLERFNNTFPTSKVKQNKALARE
jgi:hypothetical protein